MKLIFIIVIFAICNSCGTKKLPTETITKKINPADQDFDLLTKEQEEKIGSDPSIPDYPLLRAKMREDHPQFNINLEYTKDNESSIYSISTKLKDSLKFQQFLFTQRTKLKASKAYISSSISIDKVSPFIKFDQISNLKINLYFEKNQQKIYLLKNYFIEKFSLDSTIELSNISLEPHTTLEALFDKKSIFVEIADFTYQIPQLDKSFELKEVLQSISAQHGEILIKEAQISSSSLYGVDISSFDLINYWNYPLQDFPRQDDHTLESDSLISLTDENREYIAKTYRSNRVNHKLLRTKGIVDTLYSQAQTNSEEYLVKADRTMRTFQTRPHLFKINHSIIPSCQAITTFAHQTPKVPVDIDDFNKLIQFDISRSIQNLKDNYWNVKSLQQITWRLENFNQKTLIGDTKKVCLKYAHLISAYLPIKSMINEVSYAIEIIGMSRQQYPK